MSTWIPALHAGMTQSNFRFEPLDPLFLKPDTRNLEPFFPSSLDPRHFLIHFHPTETIFRLRNAICVASGKFFGQTSWHAISDMQPKTPSSSPITSK